MTRALPPQWVELMARAGFRSVRSLASAAGVSAPATARLIHGTGKVSDATIQAIAGALDVDPGLVYRFAGEAVANGLGPYLPPPEAARLTLHQRQVVTKIIRALVK